MPDDFEPPLPATFDDHGHVTGPSLHGTRAAFAPGDSVLPGRPSHFRPDRPLAHVYFTTRPETAAWGAELAAALATNADGPPQARVYQVEPTGPFEDDPNVTSAVRTHLRRVSVDPIPRLAAIDSIVLPLRFVLVTRLGYQPDRPVLQLLWIPPCHACHRTPSSRIGASGHTGAVQSSSRRCRNVTAPSHGGYRDVASEAVSTRVRPQALDGPTAAAFLQVNDRFMPAIRRLLRGSRIT